MCYWDVPDDKQRKTPMSSQPLNSAIHVYQRVRAQRAFNLHRSVWEVGNGAGINPLKVVVPGEEGMITATRDAVNDIVTTSLTTDRNDGYAIVRYRLSPLAFEDAVADANIPNERIKIVRIGKDAFIENKDAYLTRDLFGDVKALFP
jgi:hypothetical protein